VAESANELFGELVRIMARLRGENGCPWDREQTHQSIKPYFVEETYEVLEAIDEGDADKLCEELGDVMLQVVFHARMAEEAELFQIGDVLQAITEKLVRRHPHVFGTVQADTAQEVLFNWEQIKKTERQNAKGHASLLDGVPRELPALLRAHRLQEKASRVGFDWKEARDVLAKVEEELVELRAAIAPSITPPFTEACRTSISPIISPFVDSILRILIGAPIDTRKSSNADRVGFRPTLRIAR
jgi:tetrapyrrole methylase family protein/MazG family protein